MMSSPFRLIIAVSLAAGLISGCRKKPEIAAIKPPEVTVTQAVERDVNLWHEYTGRLDAVESVEIRSRVSGYLESVAFEDGATVKKGDLLCKIDRRTFDNQLQSAQAELARAKSTYELHKTEFDRAAKLISSNAISQEEYDKRASAQAQAQSAIDSAEATIAEAKLNIDFSEIRAPIDGVVSRLMISAGNIVTADVTLITTIVSSDPVYGYFQVDESRMLGYFKQMTAGGATASVETLKIPVALGLTDESNFPHKGVIDFVDNRINPATGTIAARATFPNPTGKLKAGLFARIRVSSGEGGNHIVVPPRAVTNNQDRKVVYVVGKDNMVEYREVRLGPIEDGEQVVFDGLKAGETIIVDGLLYARPGAPVAPKSLPAAAPVEAAPASEKAATKAESDVQPTISVTALYPGANAQTVAEMVAAPIEREINGVENMLYITSQNGADGSMNMTVTFKLGTDLDQAQVLVQNRVSTALSKVPEEVRQSGVMVKKQSPASRSDRQSTDNQIEPKALAVTGPVAATPADAK